LSELAGKRKRLACAGAGVIDAFDIVMAARLLASKADLREKWPS